MCIFSGEVADVGSTKIFGRVDAKARTQVLVYEMSVRARDDQDVAMVLPLPVLPGSGEAGCRFVSLEGAADLFSKLDVAFPKSRSWKPQWLDEAAPGTLAVHRVGSYVASYVPTLADFARLSPRFRLPKAALDAHPDYADFGFAVFQLDRGVSGKVHPMALVFATRDPSRVFFPTTHVHDGEHSPRFARFDHALYWQGTKPKRGATESLGNLPRVPGAEGVVDASRPGFKLELDGEWPNEDVWVDV